MPDVTKRFGWGPSVEAILHHFSTPEIKALGKYCRKLIEDFTNPELEGEGYRCSVVPFEMFEYGFSLNYNFDEEIWQLHVLVMPDFDDPQCPRKRPPPAGRGGTGGARRAVGYERGEWRMLSTVIKNTAREFSTFMRDTRTGFAHYSKLRTKYIDVAMSSSHVTACIQMLNAFAEQGTHGCKDAVLVVRSKVSTALAYLGPLWSYADCTPSEKLWDPGLFGRQIEPASG